MAGQLVPPTDGAPVTEQLLLDYAGEDRPQDVRTLVLRNMNIAEVEGLFEPFCAVEVLSLSNNKISTIGSCRVMGQLSVLNINFNRVSNLDPLVHCPELRQLYASNNKISTVSPLVACKRLVALSLYHNQIASLDGVLGVLGLLPELIELDLASNPCALGPPYRHRVVRDLRLTTLDGESLTELDQQLAADFWQQPDELSARAYEGSIDGAATSRAEQATLAGVNGKQPMTPRTAMLFRDPFLNSNSILLEYMCDAELKRHRGVADSGRLPDSPPLHIP